MEPLTAFNFVVRLELDGVDGLICDGAFSEVTGLEASLETETIREGGNNVRQIHLAGAVSYGQVTLKRGLTRGLGLWRWFSALQDRREARAHGEIAMLSADRATEMIRFKLTGCLPVKIKAPPLNAMDGLVAIEELVLASHRIEVS